MRKEIFIAIVLGFIIGLVIVFGVITARTALNQRQEATTEPSTGGHPTGGISPTISPPTLTISEPADGAVIDTDTITLRGTTTPHASVVVSTEKGDFITNADVSASFSQELTLINGVNEIQIVSFAPSGDRSEVTITIVFSTANF